MRPGRQDVGLTATSFKSSLLRTETNLQGRCGFGHRPGHALRSLWPGGDKPLWWLPRLGPSLRSWDSERMSLRCSLHSRREPWPRQHAQWRSMRRCLFIGHVVLPGAAGAHLGRCLLWDPLVKPSAFPTSSHSFHPLALGLGQTLSSPTPLCPPGLRTSA